MSSDNEDYITKKELAAKLGVSPTYIMRMVNGGALPQPIRITKRIHRWRWKDVEAHINARQKEEA